LPRSLLSINPIALLQTFEENSTLEGVLGELIVPAVKRKELILREKGLVCLGLCCLIARRMALNSFQLFLSQVQTAPEVLKLRVLQVVFDVLMVHEGDFLANASVGGGRVIEFLLQVLGNEESDKVQALICAGFAKLMLSGMITDERVLSSLALIYLSPDTAENQELRQCLSYFFPAYSYSSPTHQRLMQEIFLPVLDQLSKARRELDEGQEMVSSAQVCAMFVDWTDPQKAINIEALGQTADQMIHMDMAAAILRTLFGKDIASEPCSFLEIMSFSEQVIQETTRKCSARLLASFTSRLKLPTTTKSAHSNCSSKTCARAVPHAKPPPSPH
jgi:condensin complex subunit 3